MSVLRVGGLASGLDTHGIIEQLMKVERMPLDKLKQQKQIWQWKQEDYRTINTALSAFRNTVFNMQLSSTYRAKTAVSSNPNGVSGTIGSEAQDGTYTIEVLQMATKSHGNSTETISLDPSDTINITSKLSSIAGKFKNQPQNSTFTINGIEFAVDTDKDSLRDIMNRVNSSEAGVHMFYDSAEDRIFISSKGTGSGSNIQIEGNFLTDTLKLDTSDMNNYTQGKDAIVKINGYQLTRTSNTIVFGGLTYTVKEEGILATIEVKQDIDKIIGNIKNFVQEYNNLLRLINGKLTEERNRDYMPLTDEQRDQLSEREIERWEDKARAGHLRNDRLLNTIVTNMRRILGDRVGESDLGSLSAIGITTGHYSERGLLQINESRLRAVLEEDADKVYRLFSVDNEEGKGIAVQLDQAISRSIQNIISQAGRPTASYDQSFISRQIRNIDDRIFRMEDKLERIEDRYWRQFTSLEKALNTMNEQSMWLAQQLMAMQPMR